MKSAAAGAGYIKNRTVHVLYAVWCSVEKDVRQPVCLYKKDVSITRNILSLISLVS